MSDGIFAKDAPFKGKNPGRRVNFSDHDDRGSERGGGGGGGGGGGRRGRGGQRGRWRGRRGGRSNRGGLNSRNRLEAVDDDGDAMMDEAGSSRGSQRYNPYGGRPKFGGKNTSPDSRPSVFLRLGASASNSTGSVFSRLSGLGGGEKFSSMGSSWHKITIIQGANHSREWVLKQLQASTKEPFQAVQVHVRGDKLMFFVEDSRIANQLKRLGKLESRDGTLLVIVKPCPPPRGAEDGDQRQPRFQSGRGGPRRGSSRGRGGGGAGGGAGGSVGRGGAAGGMRFDGDVQMEEDTTAVVLQMLGQRFDSSTRSLDLSDVFHDQTLREHGVKGVMYDRSFVGTVLALIGQHCPDLLSLDLSNNRLQHLDVYSELPTKCANLQILNLSDNQLRSAAELESFRGMSSLTTLVLENNPCSQHSQDFISYASNMRKFFPGLQLLDGQQLPSPVKFDLPVSAGQLPPVERYYLVNDEVKNLVVTFLEQYFSIYDGDSREKLLEAYSNDAVFSLAVAMQPAGRGPPLQTYIQQSRNLGRVKEAAKRHSLLKHGKIDIVQCLRDLPKTCHHAGAFSVDVIRATPISTAFVVYGVFSEVGEPKRENHFVRAFSRTFVLAAAGNGVAIINDQLTIRNANQKSVQFAREEMAKLAAQQQPALLPQAAALGQPSTSGLTTSPPAGPTFHSPPPTFGNAQEEAIIRFSEQTRMNVEWSRKCLSENEWDYNKAVLAFNLLQSQGRIPPEAFTS